MSALSQNGGENPEDRPHEFLVRDPSVTGRSSFRKRGGIINPIVKIGENNLADIDEPDVGSIVDNLRRRYLNNAFYTYIGDVLIYMPPFSGISMYTDEDVQYYCENNAFDPDLKPHIYSFADRVYSNMLFWKRNQVVIMSGGSGSGKTINTKQFLSYIQSVSGGWDLSVTLKTRLAHLFNVLDCFGSAQTADSIYASKYTSQLQLKFNYFGDIVSCQLKTCLLEKSRVCGSPPGESNFHIFHLLMEHIGSDGSAYPFLSNTSHTFALKVTLASVQDSLVALGMPEGEKEHVINILTAILILGQIQFKTEGDGVGVKITNPAVVKVVAKLLGVTTQSVTDMLTSTPHISGNRSIMMNPLSYDKAVSKRNALAGYLYLRLFNEVLTSANKSLAGEVGEAGAPESPDELCLTLDIVDGYGIKGGDLNNFAVLCCNFSNEKLHQCFIESALTAPQELYLQEGLDWDPIRIPDNRGTIGLFTDLQPESLTECIERECNKPGETTNFQADEAFGGISSPYFMLSHEVDNEFIVRHYIGEVSYDATNFHKMAKTGLPKDCKRVMNSSKLALLQRMFPDGAQSEWMKGKSSMCVAQAYVGAIDNLLNDLKHKFLSFVRCIKPNLSSTPQLFEDDIVEDQVRSSCLVETALIKQRGFAFSSDLVGFVQRYKCTHEEDRFSRCDGDWQMAADRICGNLQIDMDLYFVGFTCIFIKDSATVLYLEKKRDECIDFIVTKIQLCWKRRYINRKLGPHLRAVRETLAQADRTKKIVLPKLRGPFSDEINDYLERIYRCWWASCLIKTLRKPERAICRIMITAHAAFAGELSVDPDLVKAGKPMNIHSLRMRSNYITSEQFDPAAILGQTNIEKAAHGKKVLFTAPINRLNRKHVVERGNVVLTDRALIFLTSKFELYPQKTILLKNVRALSLSTHVDTMIVIHQAEAGKDMVLDFGVTGIYHTLPEFVGNLYLASKKLHNRIHVNVYVERIRYNNSRKPDVYDELSFSAKKEKSSKLKPGAPLCTLKNKVVIYYGGRDVLH